MVATQTVTPTLSPVLRQDLVAYKRVPPPSCMHSLLQIGLSHKAASSHLIVEDPITCISQLKKNIQSLHLRKWAVSTPSECVTREKNTASSNYEASTLRTWSFTYLETRKKKRKKKAVKARLKAEKQKWDFSELQRWAKSSYWIMHIYHEFTVKRICASPWGRSLVLV